MYRKLISNKREVIKSLMGFTPTDEQLKVIEAIENEDRVKVEAFAGSGKTTTLEMIAKVFKEKRIRIFAFNRSVADELNDRMPDNVRASTIHSFALWQLNQKGLFKGKIAEKRELIYKIKELYPGLKYPFILLIIDVLEFLCQQFPLIDELTPEQVKELLESEKDWRLRIIPFLEDITYDQLLYYVKGVYDSMKKGEVNPTFSFLLKYYHELATPFKFADIIMLDEAQDVNPVQVAIIERLEPQKFLLVGDTHQSIYAWRGAVNSLDLFDYPTCYLTHSFRFATPVPVEFSNKVLAVWKGETKKMKGGDSNKVVDSFAFISRTNLEIIKRVSEEKKPFRLKRKVNEIFSELLLAEALYKVGKGIASDSEKEVLQRRISYYLREILKKEGYDGLKEYLELYEPSLAKALAFAEKENVKALYELFEKLSNAEGGENYYYLTAHTAKGLEFGEVVLGRDFPSPYELFAKAILERHNDLPRETIIDLLKVAGKEVISNVFSVFRNPKERTKGGIKEIVEEINLIYVAVTRAINKITIPIEVGEFTSIEEETIDVGRLIAYLKPF